MAPSTLSLLEDAPATVGFFRELAESKRRYPSLWVDLSGVKRLTHDGIALLISHIKDKSGGGKASVAGNEPADGKVRALLLESGFYKHVYRRGQRRDDEPEEQGEMLRQIGLHPDGELMRRLIHGVTARLYGKHQDLRQTYRVLMEAANNTFDHASPRGPARQGRRSHAEILYAAQRRERWLALAHYDRDGFATFCLLDRGVGILNSANFRWFTKAQRKLGIAAGALLQKVFDGTIESSTGQPYRGLGLPAIRRCAEHPTIRDLTVVTNDAVANLGAGVYKTLGVDFRGTLYMWRVVR